MATTTTTNPTTLPKINASKKRIFVIALGVIVAIAVAAGVGYFLSNNRMGPPTAAAHVLEIPIFIALEPFTVNLQSEGRPRFLHIGVTLKVRDAKSQEQVAQYLPEARSRLLMLLSNRKPESLSTPEDKNQLSAEILKTLNKPFSSGPAPQQITDVVFTAFVVQ